MTTDPILSRKDFEACVESTNGEDPNMRPYEARHYLLAHDAALRARIAELEGELENVRSVKNLLQDERDEVTWAKRDQRIRAEKAEAEVERLKGRIQELEGP